MKTVYAIRDGKVVELKKDNSQPEFKERAFYIGKSSGLNWGVPKNRVDTRVTNDSAGNMLLHKRYGHKKNTYISKK